MKIEGCKVERTTWERIRVVGPMSLEKEVMDRLHREGWSIKQSGPYCDRKMWPRVDVTRFLYLAEREITKEPS